MCVSFLCSDSRRQHAGLPIKGGCTATLFLLRSCDLCTLPVPPPCNLCSLSVSLPPSLPPRPLVRPTASSTPSPPAAHMQAKKRYLLVSVGAGLLFLFYLWALQVGEFQQHQQPYQYHQFPQYPEYHLDHQQALSHYQHSPGVDPPRPLPQRTPPRPSRPWAWSPRLLEPYLEGGEQEVNPDELRHHACRPPPRSSRACFHVFRDRTTGKAGWRRWLDDFAVLRKEFSHKTIKSVSQLKN